MKISKEQRIDANRAYLRSGIGAESSANAPSPCQDSESLTCVKWPCSENFGRRSMGTHAPKGETFMANAAMKIPTAAPSPRGRPALTLGQAHELTMISARKPVCAKRMRDLLREGFDEERRKHTGRIGTVHDLRFVILDNVSRVIFASTFDGTWETYIDDS